MSVLAICHNFKYSELIFCSVVFTRMMNIFTITCFVKHVEFLMIKSIKGGNLYLSIYSVSNLFVSGTKVRKT